MEEQNQELPIEPTAQDCENSSDSVPVGQTNSAGNDEVPASSSPSDVPVRETLERMIPQISEQAFILKSAHGLLVDIAARITQMSDESVSRAQRPIFVDLVMLYDSIQQVLVWIRNSSDASRDEILHRLTVLESELLEVLARRDVRPFDDSPTVLDRQLHRAVKTVGTSDPEQNNRVLQVVRTGFFIQNEVLRPEEVVISKHNPLLQVEGD